MTIPSWLLSKPALYAGAVVLVMSAGGLWLHAYVGRAVKAAVTAQQVKQTEAARAKQDTVVQKADVARTGAIAHTDTVFVLADSATQRYGSLRNSIDTVSAQQPLGVPIGYVVVPIAYVRAADSIAAVIPVMEAALEQERAAASLRIAAGDSSIALLRTEVAELRVADELHKPGISGKLKTAGIGMLIGAVVVEAIRHR